MGTAHGAEELRLCSHELACQASAWARYIGFCIGYGHIWKIQYWKGQQKYSARPITLAHDKIFKKRIFACKTWNAADADRNIAQVNRTMRGRAIGTYLRTHFG
jgi:hypothetical protein